MSEKQLIIEKYQAHASDTGTPEVQIALLTSRINELKKHFDLHRKDFHSRRGLISMVNKRRNMLQYLMKKSMSRYVSISEHLSLRTKKS